MEEHLEPYYYINGYVVSEPAYYSYRQLSTRLGFELTERMNRNHRDVEHRLRVSAPAGIQLLTGITWF